MKKTLVGLAAILSIAMGYNHFRTVKLCDGFLPTNNLHIPTNSFATGGITEVQFNAIMDRLERLYSAEIQSLGGQFNIERNWSDSTVNAFADRTGNTWTIHMYGGVARHPDINVEGMALIACHELGHHLGGAPRFQKDWTSLIKDMTWASVEGEADYFATLKCLRKFFAEDNNEAILANHNNNPIAMQACQQQYSDRQEQLICMRISMGTESATALNHDVFSDGTPAPQYNNPDTSVVTETVTGHPAAQCRMDTFFAGANCKADINVPVGQDDAKVGACYAGHDTVGFRPACWYANAN